MTCLLTAVQSWGQLRRVSLAKCSLLTDATVQQLSSCRTLPLEDVDFSFCSRLTEPALWTLALVSSLVRLQLTSCLISLKFAEQLLRKRPSLLLIR